MLARTKKIAANLALTVGALVFFLILFEIGATILVKIGLGRLNQIVGKAGNIVMNSPNSDLGYVYKPNYTDAEGNTITNALGLHEYEWTPLDLRQSKVILNIGDSITFGVNVRDIGRVYGKVIQSLINESKISDENYIVYNAGIGGYNTWQEYALLKDLTGKIKYDMVILGLCLNDSSPQLYVSEDVKGAVVNVPGKIVSVEEMFSRKFLGRIKTYVILKESIKSIQKHYPKMFPSSMLWHNLLVKEAEWKNLKDTLLDMKETLDKKNIPFMIAIFPYEHQLKLKKEDNIIQNDLMQFCQSHSIHCLDLFDSYHQNRDVIHWDLEGDHPDENGHMIAGKVIYEYLTENHLIPIKPTRVQNNASVINHN